MMKHNSNISAGLVALAVSWSACAGGLAAEPAPAPVQVPVTSVWPKGSSWYQDLGLAASQAGEATQGRVEIVLQDHSATFGTLPELAIYTMPLLFRGEEELKAVRARLDADLADLIAKRGLVIWDLQTIGTAHLFSRLPIRSVDDFLASRVWVPKETHDVKYDEVGLKHPVPLDLRLLRDALRNDEIDSFMLTPTAALLKRYHTRVAVVSRQALTYVVAPLWVEQAALARLSPEDQALVKDTMVQGFRRAARSNREKDEEAMKAFDERENLTISDEIDFSQPEWQSWAENARKRLANGKIVPPEIYEKAKAILSEHRGRTAGLP